MCLPDSPVGRHQALFVLTLVSKERGLVVRRDIPVERVAPASRRRLRIGHEELGVGWADNESGFSTLLLPTPVIHRTRRLAFSRLQHNASLPHSHPQPVFLTTPPSIASS